MFKYLALLGVAFAKPEGLPECIADLEQLVQDGEQVITDFKAGNMTAAITEIEALVGVITKAKTDCAQSAEGLPECIADIEELVQDAEKVLADVKAGNETAAITDIEAVVATIQKATTDCKQSTYFKNRAANLKDLPTCITDLETLIQDGEQVIADFKSGNLTDAIAEIEALVGVIQKAEADCKLSGYRPVHSIVSRAANLKDLPTCIADLEMLVQDAEKVIADLKAGNETAAITDIEAAVASIQKAMTDCTASGYKKSMWFQKRADNLKDLPTCIADLESLVQDGEQIIADFKSGNLTAAISEIEAIVAVIQKAETDCAQSGYVKSMWFKKRAANLKGLPECIADLEQLVQDAETVVADFKAGNTTAAITEIEAIIGVITKAKTDCTASGYTKIHSLQSRVNNLKDLPTCIADLEGLVQVAEKVIADLKAGNETAAIADIEAAVADIQKALTDCQSSGYVKPAAFKVGGMIGCIADLESLITDGKAIVADFQAGNMTAAITEIEAIVGVIQKAETDCANVTSTKLALGAPLKLKVDPKRDYFEKMGARFAAGFMAGTNVGHFDEIDLYECIQREPKALGIFYKADETLKAGWLKKDSSEAVEALDEMVYFIVEMIMEPYPGTQRKVCSTIDNSKSDFTELKTIIGELRNKETTLIAHDETLMFNKQNVTKEAFEMAEDYLKGNFMYLGWRFGKTLADNSNKTEPVTQVAVKEDPKRDYFEKQGARFAAGFMAGTNVGHFDEIDLYECIKLEPKALEIFYRADETLKYAFIKHESEEAVKALDEMVYFIVEMIMEPYPGTQRKVCSTIDNSKSNFDELKTVIGELRDKDTTLETNGKEWMFNKQDISKEAGEMAQDYIKGNFMYLGWRFGKALADHSKAPSALKFLN